MFREIKAKKYAVGHNRIVHCPRYVDIIPPSSLSYRGTRGHISSHFGDTVSSKATLVTLEPTSFPYIDEAELSVFRKKMCWSRHELKYDFIRIDLRENLRVDA